MSEPKTILSAIKTALTDAASLSYVKQVILGVRENITRFPTIVLEPLAIEETDEIYDRQELRIRVGILGFIHAANSDKQIIGDDNYTGILDLENDIKKVISSNATWSGNAIHTRIIETRFDFAEFPRRGFSMEIEVLLRQHATDRT